MKIITKGEIITDVLGISFSEILSSVGKGTIRLPWKYKHLFNEAEPNQSISFSRNNAKGESDDYYFWVQGIKTNDTKNREIEVAFSDSLSILEKRIVAYQDTSPEAEKEIDSFTAMVEIIRENIGTGSSPNRRLPLLIRNGSYANGPTVHIKVPFKNILSALKDIQNQSQDSGYETLFKFYYNGVKFVFSPHLNYIRDKRRIIFSNYDLLNQVEYVNFEKNYNSVYAGGAGRGLDRIVILANNEPSILSGDYNLNETFLNLTNVNEPDLLGAIANQALTQFRIRKTVSFEIQETKNKPFGGKTGWKTGDIVSVIFENKTMPALIRGIKYDLTANGSQKIIAKLEI